MTPKEKQFALDRIRELLEKDKDDPKYKTLMELVTAADQIITPPPKTSSPLKNTTDCPGVTAL